MKVLTRALLMGASISAALAAVAQHYNSSWCAVLLSCLSGGAWSALFSLVMGRMQYVHQVLAEALAAVKLTNPLTASLGHELRAQLEVLTDLGFSEASPAVSALAETIEACNRGQDHGVGADPIYRAVPMSGFGAAIESLLFPKHVHRDRRIEAGGS